MPWIWESDPSISSSESPSPSLRLPFSETAALDGGWVATSGNSNWASDCESVSHSEVHLVCGTIGISDWKSGPVLVFDLQGLRPRLRLVHQNPNTSKNQTGLIKDHKKPIKTGLDWLLVLTGLNRFKTGLSLKMTSVMSVEVNLSFKMSPRTLNMVGNWIFYKNIQ